MKHLWNRRAALVMLPAGVALWQCRAPTQIALDLRIDVPCTALTGVSIHATQATPVDINPLGTVVQAASGIGFSCVRNDVGSVSCWGTNDWGELADGTMNPRATPMPIVAFNDAVDVALDYAFACAVRRFGTVVCWGFGYVGGGGNCNVYPPTNASGLIDVIQVAVAQRPSGATDPSNACALRRNGAVMCWGDNTYGQVGDSTFDTRTIPTAVLGLP